MAFTKLGGGGGTHGFGVGDRQPRVRLVEGIFEFANALKQSWCLLEAKRSDDCCVLSQRKRSGPPS